MRFATPEDASRKPYPTKDREPELFFDEFGDSERLVEMFPGGLAAWDGRGKPVNRPS